MADADDSRTAHEAALEALIPAEEREAFERGVVALVERNRALAEGRLPSWQLEPGMEHLRDDAPYRICDGCGLRSWVSELGEQCGLPQPDGGVCPGSFGVLHLASGREAAGDE